MYGPGQGSTPHVPLCEITQRNIDLRTPKIRWNFGLDLGRARSLWSCSLLNPYSTCALAHCRPDGPSPEHLVAAGFVDIRLGSVASLVNDRCAFHPDDHRVSRE
jgi:hypothetical protein